jgi:hypothetical protein
MTEERNNGWIHGKSRLPTEADGDGSGKVMVWHAYQGAMLCRWDEYSKNPFFFYWMPVSDATDKPWIKAAEKGPTKGDADALNCVLAKDRHDDISVTGWHQFGWNNTLVCWLPLPGPPSDYIELRRMK